MHTLLRLADADLVVKVIDACNSGTLLVKADGTFQSTQKQGFKNLIQISSCRQSQNSLTGEPLSVFTNKFRAAALRKKAGTVYYTDIVNTLRDEFIQNDDQTPFFVFQVTGREQFVDDAKRLDDLRAQLAKPSGSNPQSQPGDLQTPQAQPPNLHTLLEVAESNVATPDKIHSFVNTFFDNLSQTVSNTEYTDFFDLKVAEHADFSEPTTEAFTIRVLSRQTRPDEFVTATISRERTRTPFDGLGTSVLSGVFGDDQRYREVYDLELNCKMQRVQLKITLTPKYHSLKQLVIVVTCAPSLQNCYVFEIGTQHSLTDFGEYSVEGNEIVCRWYKFKWSDNTDGVVIKITAKLDEIVRGHLEHTEQQLTKEET